MTMARTVGAGSSAVRRPTQTPDAAATGCPRHALNVRFGRDAGRDVALGDVRRPVWRGAIHVAGLGLAVPAVIVLLTNATGDTPFRVSLVIYALGLCWMLAASATYHRWVHGLRARSVWRRVDHSAIFAAIAGSSTPIAVAALPGRPGWVLVGVIWSAAFVGAGCKLSRRDGGDRAGTAMYVVTIGLGAVAMPWLWGREGVGSPTFIVGGGVFYLIGAACFAKQWPTLRPTVFSYHEVWHAFTIVAAGGQYVGLWMIAT